MKNVLTIILITLSSAVIAQRPGSNYERLLEAGKFAESINDLKDNDDLFFLYPGNWENAEAAATYVWEDGDVNMGYMFGTNTYEDDAYGQVFRTDYSYIIHGAFFWIGERYGEHGDVVFTVWNYSNGSVGSALVSKTISLADIIASELFDEAFWVEFDQPVLVTSDFLIGADVSRLDSFEEDVYGFGNVSSLDGDGAGAGLALILEDGSWRPVLDYNMDVDIAIFPLVEEAVLKSVTFNVDMNEALIDGDFDPEQHDVYISGSFANWTTPGEAEAYKLSPTDAKNEKELVYTVAFDDVYAGKHEYKYYIVEDEPTWNMAEYPEDRPDRLLFLDANMTVDDVFGSVFQANIYDFWFLKQDDFDDWVDADVVDHLEIEYVDDDFGKVNVYVEFGTNINDLTPTMTVTYGASIDPYPETGDLYDFGEDAAKTYTVVSADPNVTKDWKITIYKTEELSVPGIDEKEHSLVLYPNPVRNSLNVEHTGFINSVKIFDITGRMIYNEQVNNNQAQINVSGFTQGVYIIQVITDSEIQSRKFQVTR